MNIHINESWNFDSWWNDNFPYSSRELDKKFNEKKLAEFKKQMAQIEKDVDPKFLDMFKNYESRVSKLLSENLSVVGSKVVQEELTKQNTGVSMAFKKDSMKLSDAYKNIFWWAVNDTDYRWDDLAA